MFRRDLAGVIRKLAMKFPVLSITGPWQSGKTTLVKDVFKDHIVPVEIKAGETFSPRQSRADTSARRSCELETCW